MDELVLDGDGVDDDVAGAGLFQLALVGGGDIASGAQEDGADCGIWHGCEEEGAEAKLPGGSDGGFVVEAVELVHEVVDVVVGADGDERQGLATGPTEGGRGDC